MSKKLAAFVALGIALAVTGCGGSDSPSTNEEGVELREVKFGIGSSAVFPGMLPFVIPKELGWYAEEGLSVETLPLGSNEVVLSSLRSGDIDFGVVTTQFTLLADEVAAGEDPGVVNFHEYTYPFKWDFAVLPDSSITTLDDLRGLTIGVSTFGTTDYTIGQELLSRNGIDPDADVEWLAVGEGIAGGLALEGGDIDALMYYDTGFGQIESQGIELRYLERPSDLPLVGGIYIMATDEYLAENREVAVSFARSVAKAQVFALEDPVAAVKAMLAVEPSLAPRGVSDEEAIDAVLLSIEKRVPLYKPYAEELLYGETTEKEWVDSVEFYGLDDVYDDVSILYTNELVAEVNDFDEDQIRELAREYGTA